MRVHLLRWHNPRKWLWGREKSPYLTVEWTIFHLGPWYIETCPVEFAHLGEKPLLCWKAWS